MGDLFIVRVHHDGAGRELEPVDARIFPYMAVTLVETSFVARDRVSAYFLYVIPFFTFFIGFVATVFVATAPDVDHALALPVGIGFGVFVVGCIGFGLRVKHGYARQQLSSRGVKAARIGAWIFATYGLRFSDAELLRFVLPRYWRYGQFVSRLVRSRVGAEAGRFITYAVANRPDGSWLLYTPEYECEAPRV